MREIIIIAPAKVNLDLKITGRREDGYHMLNSLVAFTQWGDALWIKPSDGFGLTLTGPCAASIDGAADSNLVTRAVRLMEDKAGKIANIHVTMNKNIPVGAGLGGGSSDAATIMLYLNTLWGTPFTLDVLSMIGLNLGADVPICLQQQTCRMEGIGDRISRADLPAVYHDKWVVIAWPNQALLTKDVFGAYHTSPRLSHNVPNDLQDTACALLPDIRDILDLFSKDNACVFHTMSGSGGACFGLYETEDNAHIACANHKNGIVTRWRDMGSIEEIQAI